MMTGLAMENKFQLQQTSQTLTTRRRQAQLRQPFQQLSAAPETNA